MRVLGIDPGLRITGYGCIEPAPGGARIIEAGVFRLARKGENGAGPSVSLRLVELDRDFRDLLARVTPDLVAVEGLFAHYKHPATAIVMGHARGVLLLAAEQAGLPLVELKPTTVKKSLVGWGRADKSQMQRAIQSELGLAELPKPPDVADALAIALTALQRSQNLMQ
ncbi:Crossover junction endodeoxyribonuclease RuvC [Phycisphaerales bacterium]|nr:Crossover junction endodeoxyribonuclease RuvC [Phycisphaerales bacterium]